MDEPHWEVLLRDGDDRASVIVPLVEPMTPEQVLQIARVEMEDYEVMNVTFRPGRAS